MTRIRPGAGLRIPTRSIVASVGALALASAAAVTLGASEPSVTSAWRTQDITIDGSSDDWTAFSTLSDKPPISVAAANDGQFLYLAVRTSDPGARMMIERQGLVVWLDAKGKKNKRFGLHYPETAEMPAPGEGRFRRPGGYGGGGSGYGGRGGSASGEPPQQGERQGPPPDPQTDGRWQHMEIMGPGKDDKRDLMLDHAPGFEVKVGDHEGVLTYELRVPLQVTSEDPYAIGVEPGAVIGLGLETPKIEMPRRPGGFGGGMGGRGGGMGGMGGGEMGGMGGRRGGFGGEGGQFGGRTRMEPLKLWATVTLATAAPAQ